VLPLSDIVDWRALALHVSVDELPRLPDFLRSIPPDTVRTMQRRVLAAHRRYFASLAVTTRWGMEVLRRRLFPALWDVGGTLAIDADLEIMA